MHSWLDPFQEAEFHKLLLKIKQILGVDFTGYRVPCIKRRIDSRIRHNQLNSYTAYTKFLENHASEQEHLLKTLTIHLTEFFRDKSAWSIIQKKIIPAVLQQKLAQKNTKISVWSAGCSSGEETYTVAMLFHAALDENLKHVSLNIYGTDVDSSSIEKARLGKYSEKNIAKIPRRFVKRYFTYDGEYYWINEELRSCISFKCIDITQSTHDFSLDLIICRNVLIYFNRALQIKILEMFNQALVNQGFLMLGKTESILYHSQPNLKVIDSRERIYKKLE